MSYNMLNCPYFLEHPLTMTCHANVENIKKLTLKVRESPALEAWIRQNLTWLYSLAIVCKHPSIAWHPGWFGSNKWITIWTCLCSRSSTASRKSSPFFNVNTWPKCFLLITADSIISCMRFFMYSFKNSSSSSSSLSSKLSSSPWASLSSRSDL